MLLLFLSKLCHVVPSSAQAKDIRQFGSVQSQQQGPANAKRSPQRCVHVYALDLSLAFDLSALPYIPRCVISFPE